MTISTVTSKVIYVGTGSTAGAAKIFAYPFKIDAEAQIDAQEYNVTTSVSYILTLNSQYAVTGVGSSSGGNVILTGSYTNLPSGRELVIRRIVSILQETDYVENDPFSAETLEDALDHLVMIDQQQQEAIDRCIAVDIAQQSANVVYSDFVNLAAAALSSGVVAANYASSAGASAVAAGSSETNAAGSATAAASSAVVAVDYGAVCQSYANVTIAEAALTSADVVTCASSADVSVTQASDAAVSAVLASGYAATAGSQASYAILASGYAGVAQSSSVVCVDQSAIAVSSATVTVIQTSTSTVFANLASDSAVACASSATVAVAQGNIAVSSAAVTVASNAAGASSAAVAVAAQSSASTAQVAASSSATVSVTQASNAAVSAVNASTSATLIPSPVGQTAGYALVVNGTENGWTFGATLTAAAVSVTRVPFYSTSLSAGVLDITHGATLSLPYTLLVSVFNSSGYMVIPDNVTVSASTVHIGLSTANFTVTGTWGVCFIA